VYRARTADAPYQSRFRDLAKAVMRVRSRRWRTLVLAGALQSVCATASELEAQRPSSERAVPVVDSAGRHRAALQDDPAQRLITLAVRDVSVQSAIELLVERSGISLVYASEALGPTRSVSCRSDNERAERMLACIVRGAGLDYYRLSSGTFVVIARAEDAPAYASLTGLVRDATSGAPVPQARVSLAEFGDVRTAGSSGGFAFTRLRPGRYRLMATAIGYQARFIELVVPDSGAARTTIRLERHAAIVAPVVVNGLVAGLSSAINRPNIAAVDIPVAVLGPSLLQAAAPALMGVSPNSGTGDLHIQGGASGEHQLRLDGVPIFDPIAVDRIYGAFSPLAIGRMTVQRAGYSASAGSFTAGVIDLEHTLSDGMQSSGARPALTLQVDPGSASARVFTRSTPGGRDLSTMLAVRGSLWSVYRPAAVTSVLRSWNMMSPVLTQRLASAGLLGHQGADVDASLPIARTGSDLRFLDVHAAARYGLGAFSSLTASGYLGRNRIGSDVTLAPVNAQGIDSARALAASEAYRWTTAGAQLRYDALLGARTQTSLQLRRSEHALRYGFMLAPMRDGAVAAASTPVDRNGLVETALEGTLNASVGEALTVQWTATLARTTSTMQMASGVLRDLRTDIAASRAVGAVDVTWHVRRTLWVDAGLRNTWLLSTGRSEGEPRLAIRGEGQSDRLGRTAWRIGGGTYRQYVTQFDLATTAPNALVPTMRFWLPVDGRTPTPRAHHVAAEFVAQPAAGWEIRSETYRKWMPEIAAFNYGVLFDHDATLPHRLTASDFIGSSRGDAWGAGVRIIREKTRAQPTPVLRAELGYDYGVSRRTFPSRFGGTLQPTPWNEPHRVTLATDWRPHASTVITARARVVQGRSWGLRQVYYDLLSVSDVGAGLPLQNPGAADKPVLITSDIGITRTVAVWRSRADIGVAVLNVLGRQNILDYGLQRQSTANATTYDQVPRFLMGRQWSLSVRVSPP
jgi:Carboxypeptidase regulatory-like domain